MEMEFEDVKSFVNFYRDDRKNGALSNPIKIGKNEKFTVYSYEEKEILEKCYREKAMHGIVSEFMLAVMEFPNDTFHIKMKGDATWNMSPNWELGVEIVMRLRLYVLLC